MVLKDQGIES